jgi:hypothetical protein
MPYYVYKIIAGPTAMFKNLEALNEFDAFKDAQQFAKDARTQLAATATASIKVIFANNQLDAEEKLLEVREQPILREWEK